MNKIYFKYKIHPRDFFRNTDTVELPNPDEDLENFLVQFLQHYQSDERVALIDDLYKVIDNEFSDDNLNDDIINIISNKTELEIKHEIQSIETILKNEAFENFYNLVLTEQIELIHNDQE